MCETNSSNNAPPSKSRLQINIPSIIHAEVRAQKCEYFFCEGCVDAVLTGVYGVLPCGRKFAFSGVDCIYFRGNSPQIFADSVTLISADQKIMM